MGKIFFFPPYDSYRGASTEARGRGGAAANHNISAPAASVGSDALPLLHPSTGDDALRAVAPSQPHQQSAPLAPLPSDRRRRHDALTSHHRRRRHAIIPKWHCQAWRSHKGGQASEGSCSQRPGTSSSEAVVLEGQPPRAGRRSYVLGDHSFLLVDGIVALPRPTIAPTIIIPQALRIIVPPLTNEFVLLIKDTSLISVLGVTAGTRDLARFGRDGVNSTANATPLIVAGLVYLAMTVPLTQLVAWMERREKAASR